MEEDYVVRRGDSLSKIAAREGVSLDRLLELNPGIENRNLINIGQRLRLSDVSPTSLLDMLPSAPSMDGSGSSYDVALAALKELAGNANQSIYAGSQNFQSAVSDAYDSILETAKTIPGGLADAGEYLGENLRKFNWFARAMPQIAVPAARYIGFADDTLVEDKLPPGARNALAFLVANHADELREEGIQNYSLYQKYGGATDMAGMDETPSNIPMDVLAKIYGDVSPSNFRFNEDGSVTVDDRYNVNLSTDYMEDEFARRMERSGGKNLTGAFMGGAEYQVQRARNKMASYRDDMYDYKLPPEGASVNSAERELTGYINRTNLSAEEIQAAREGRFFIRRDDTAERQVRGLLRFLSTLSQPVEGGMRGF